MTLITLIFLKIGSNKRVSVAQTHNYKALLHSIRKSSISVKMLPVVAQLNNLGVAFLDTGDLPQALQLFRDALMHTVGNMQPIEHEMSPPVAARPVPGKPQDDIASPIKQGVDQSNLIPSSSARYAWDAPSASQFVHARGINVIASSTAYSPDVFVNSTVVSSIIIFNLAVVYHLNGLEECGDRSARLRKAMLLYDKSDLLLKDAGVPLSSTGNPVIDMLSMALFNNLAQASFELGGYDESRRYFDKLILFTLTVVPSRYDDAYIGSLLDQEKSNFLLNAIILHAPKLAPAA
jgi:tetratricopeptide (TPR) repeat protein